MLFNHLHLLQQLPRHPEIARQSPHSDLSRGNNVSFVMSIIVKYLALLYTMTFNSFDRLPSIVACACVTLAVLAVLKQDVCCESLVFC